MNKIKIIYDVVKTLKSKENVKGTFKAVGTKDGNQILSFSNIFERDSKKGKTKSEVLTEVNCDGKNIKIENKFEAEITGEKAKDFFGHIHSHIHQKHRQHGHIECAKGRLNKVLFFFGLLNSLKAEEVNDKAVLLSLDLADIPEELKDIIKEHAEKAKQCHEKCEISDEKLKQIAKHHQLLAKDFHSMDKKNLKLKILVNKNNEIEKVNIEASGSKEGSDKPEMEFKTELILNW
jgi:hypothetical protein